MNASKEQIRTFLLKYFDKSKEKPLRIGQQCMYGAIHRGLCNKKFLKLEN